MIDTIYIEKRVLEHTRTLSILARFPEARRVTIERYSDVFNAANQNFREQKQHPALILAEKSGKRALPTPPGYHIGGNRNFYFSHMFNCIYDCRYCFLQGMYRSANYVVFVNTNDFFSDIKSISDESTEPSWFFSGYDCDSLALDPITGFTDECLDFFERTPKAHLELRTKSTQIRPLLTRKPLPNVVVAYSLSPSAIAAAEEHQAPTLERRLESLGKLQQAGWQIGLRFDPLLYADNFDEIYGQFFEEVFATIDASTVHSASLGVFRLPKGFHKKLVQLYPKSKLLASNTEQRDDGLVTYPINDEKRMMSFCKEALLEHLEESQFFPCS